MALGIAGQSASLREFLADQLSAHYHDEDEERAKACTRFQMRVSMVTAIILSNVLVSFNWALVVGAIALLMGFGTGVFCAGTPFYTGIKRCGSPVKCGLPVSHPALDDTQLHQKHNNEDSNQLTSVSLTITNSPRGSAEVATCAPSSHAMNRQENKIKVGKARPIVFMLTTFIIVGLVSSIGNTLFIEQANALHNTRFPVFILLICASLSRWITSHIYTSLQKKLSISPSQQSLGIRIRMGLGMFLFLLCSAIAEGVEDKRLDVIRKHGLQDKPNDVVPMSVLSLLPQFILLGSAEGLSWDGLENFLDEQLPESKKMYASSLSKGMNGVGKILSVVCVAIVEAIEPTWFSDSISKSHLDKFYRMLTIFSFLNLFWYFCVARYLTSNEVIENGQVEPERTEHPVYNAVLYNSKFLMAAVGSLSSLDASEEAELWSIFKALGFARVQ
ncbi:PREDICTED: protein NRT1/ PTR FAMILY 5.5-like [Nelumbo nucifera]|uniref:Protein NRT1/ PTR FAMILY 5.5-like n=1 Tax=Nelumbo nucifera TaxID=4432 RepID=A0A1U8Q7E9_NELNU|nr:PREDICTED: protein NRT1/ PTR FAMILY 5.5-like [Nelumbo nucifera]